MTYKWYVVHVYSGSEKKVKETIEEQSKVKNMSEFIEEVMVPTEEIFEIRKDETILIHGIGGGVGIAALQIANKIGAKIIGTASAG